MRSIVHLTPGSVTGEVTFKLCCYVIYYGVIEIFEASDVPEHYYRSILKINITTT